MEKQERLSEIDLIRCCFIITLVMYHAFAIFSGAWSPLPGYPLCSAYAWIARFIGVWHMEVFVFISGYLFGNQVARHPDSILTFRNTVIRKGRRLLLPGMIFSALYLVWLTPLDRPFYYFAYQVINGVGHLWFLPMLFWCFVGVYVICRHVHLRSRHLFPLLVLLSACAFLPLPFQLTQTMRFFLYFYSGFCITRYRLTFPPCLQAHPGIIKLGGVILFLFIILANLMNTSITTFLHTGPTLSVKAFALMLNNVVRMSAALYGVAWLLLLSRYLVYVRRIRLSQRLVTVSSYCFGVYLFHQFLLQAFYYHTVLPQQVSPYLLPWLGFGMAGLGSIGLTHLTLRTRAGRFLIG